jgi:heme oxygenase
MILQRLRTETRSHHDRLDHHSLMVQLMSPAVSRPLYESLLKKFLGFYQSIEPHMAAYDHWSSFGLDLNERHKTPSLLKDLSNLHVDTRDLPRAPQPDWIQSEASAMGTFYVMEGSTLGGQVITRHVAAHLNLSPDHGLAFFSSYGDAVGARWKETREALVRFAEQSHAENVMIESAKKTFEALAAWLDKK